MKKLLIALLVFVGLIGSGLFYLYILQNKWDREQQFREAVHVNDLTTMRRLIQEGVNVDARNPKTGTSAMTSAIDGGKLEIVKLLLQHGEKSNSSGTPLDYAVSTIIGRPDAPQEKIKQIINYLIEQKIPNKRELPILTAIILGNFDFVKKLLRNLDIKNLTQHEIDKIQRATVMANNVEMLDYLLKEIPALAKQDSEGRTLLQIAIEEGKPAMVAYALKMPNADVNAKRHARASTPFQSSISFGNVEIIELLLKHGAQLDKNYYEIGEAPEEEAYKIGNQKIIDLLKKYRK